MINMRLFVIAALTIIPIEIDSLPAGEVDIVVTVKADSVNIPAYYYILGYV